MTWMLDVDDLSGGYSRLVVFRNVTFHLDGAETIGILGPNGAGKTTLLKTIAGLLPTIGGKIRFDGKELGPTAAYARARDGLVLVPEGRQILTRLSVRQNLELSLASNRFDASSYASRLEEILTIFPRLKERLDQPGGALSGGEQQMLAIGRALLMDPKLLMLDEPTQGLAPIMVRQVLAALKGLKGRIPTIIVEQNRAFLTDLADATLWMRGGVVGRSDD